MSEKIKRWMTSVDKRLGRLERSRTRPRGGGAVQDTGWVNLSLNSGWSSPTANPMQVRKVGNLVEIRGRVNEGSGTTVCTLAVEFRPAQQLMFALDEGSTSTVARLVIEQDGRVWLAGRGGTSTLISFAGVIYFSG